MMVTTTIDKQFHTKPNWYRKHRFSPEILRQIAQLHKDLDNWHGFLQVLEDWLLIGLAIIFSLWSWQNLPLIFGILSYVLAIVLIGGRQRGLRVNNHQASHKSLAKNPQLNYCLGTLFGCWTLLESFSGYDDTHNSKANGHHPQHGTDRDVDHIAVVRKGLYAPEVTPNDVKRYLLTIPLQTPNYILFLFQRNHSEKLQERVFRLIYFLAVSTVLIALGWGKYYLIYWIVPLFTTANWLGAFIQLAEHYPLITKAEPKDIYLSRNRIFSPFINLFLGTHYDGYHLVHHLFPSLPFWHSRKAHEILMQDEVYASLHQETGLKSLVKQIIYS
jgi:fatty acid desaturase